MTMLLEGEGTLFDENVKFVTMGAAHPEQFVREVQYAVFPDGEVYRYDAVEDNWYWLDPYAMG